MTKSNVTPTLNFVNCPDAVSSHRMAYWQWGNPASEHVVVCVHGLSRQGRDFDVLAQVLCDQSAQLPGGVRIVCPDVVGRGESDWLSDPMGYQIPLYVADMLALLAHLQSEARVTTLDWVGTSMGGLIGLVVCEQLRALHAPGGSAAMHASSVKAIPYPRKLVLNDVGPAIQWQAILRIGSYLGQAGHFITLKDAADTMWAISSGFGPHTPEQWLALSHYMVRPVSAHDTKLRLHYDPAIAVPFKQANEASTREGEAMLWHIYDHITAQTLLLRGASSDLLSLETAHAMTQRGPRARLVEFSGVGHAPTIIADDQVAVVSGFLLN